MMRPFRWSELDEEAAREREANPGKQGLIQMAALVDYGVLHTALGDIEYQPGDAIVVRIDDTKYLLKTGSR
jgi:hypothetical protein